MCSHVLFCASFDARWTEKSWSRAWTGWKQRHTWQHCYIYFVIEELMHCLCLHSLFVVVVVVVVVVDWGAGKLEELGNSERRWQPCAAQLWVRCEHALFVLWISIPCLEFFLCSTLGEIWAPPGEYKNIDLMHCVVFVCNVLMSLCVYDMIYAMC